MVGWLDANWLRVLGYAMAAVAALAAGLRERRESGTNPSLWPTFWFVTAALLTIMAIGRVGNVGELAAELGRRQAVSEGWYEDRRRIQAIAVSSVAAIWFIVVLVALWRVPERRRRYLPMAIVTFTLVCFAGIRLVSLHHLDALLYRRHILGVKVGALAELCLLAITIATPFWRPRALPEADLGSAPPTWVESGRGVRGG